MVVHSCYCSVRLYYTWQLFRPYNLCPLELNLDDFKQGSVCDLNLSVSLRVGWRGVVVLNLYLWAKVSVRIVVKLFPVVWDQDPRDPIPADDIPPNKVSHVLLCNDCQGFSSYPLCEVVYAYYEELQLSHRYREWSHDVQSPLSKWP